VIPGRFGERALDDSRDSFNVCREALQLAGGNFPAGKVQGQAEPLYTAAAKRVLQFLKPLSRHLHTNRLGIRRGMVISHEIKIGIGNARFVLILAGRRREKAGEFAESDYERSHVPIYFALFALQTHFDLFVIGFPRSLHFSNIPFSLDEAAVPNDATNDLNILLSTRPRIEANDGRIRRIVTLERRILS
jgi:hypothetical protein